MQERIFWKRNQVAHIFIGSVGRLQNRPQKSDGKRAGQTPSKIAHRARQLRILAVLLLSLAQLVPTVAAGFDISTSPRGSCPARGQSSSACCRHPSFPP